MLFSIIVPVYNRPEEIKDLLDSLLDQDYPNLEVIVVEDGSTVTCEAIVNTYIDKLDLHYY